eukprot:TRINITY_DN10616_c0_g1_i1.p1 TRINITY_DN10616_c0_g1~~TRINITY_DN10616_c0_g1_i1.p1  ORF type:complete len:201 (-),score=26.79 TRINITY_DN10616_c0_g1_i1:117-719(-)
MERHVLVPCADGTEEIETVSICNVLTRGSAKVTLASISAFEDGQKIIDWKGQPPIIVKGARGLDFVCHSRFIDVYDKPFDLIVLPGGMENAKRLSECERLIKLLRSQKESGKLYGAICASPAIVFAKHNLLINNKATCHPSLQSHLPTTDYANEEVVISDNCITSQGPGTAIKFGLTLVEKLFDRKKALEVAKALVYKLV